jgi:plastocyanin
MFDTKDNLENKNPGENGVESTETPISKFQTSMFEETESKPGYIHIAHEAPVEGPKPAENKYKFETKEEEEKPEGVNKAKVLAALAIVGVAAYVANWVQEPVQLKADILDSEVAQEELVAQADENIDTANLPTENVDVSLFGFEPAVLNVASDTKVIWTNTSSEAQTLIGSSANGESFTSPAIESGETFEYIFSGDDDFEYYSTYNPALKASVRVGNGAATMDDSSTTTNTQTQPEDLFGSAPETNTNEESVFSNLGDILAEQQALQNQVINSALENANNQEAVTTSTTDTNTEMAETASEEELRAAAAEMEAKELAQTGPEDMLYAVALGAIAYFNRKKLSAIFA